ncbi:hypothetical protein KC669_03590 [Candidatus Dojkabacteria bacterium]|uniref:Uncharacterized protein n=1 Tax=Candidatus Dojkabacteria bacterium TaxID=2099670 RepID=A0A955LBF2_9BACT|nr:hypothetical protein [Candidatus Dojkabacteria bacterium]
MNNRKPFALLLLALILLVVSALVIIFSTNKDNFSGYFGESGIEGVGEALTLDASISVESLTSEDNLTYTVEYLYSFTNPTDGIVYNIEAQNDLLSYFSEYNFSLLNINSQSLSLNTNFDGQNDLELLDGTDLLEPGETKTIQLTLSFLPGESEGPFNNSVSVLGYDMELSSDDSDIDAENPNTDNSENNESTPQENNVPPSNSDTETETSDSENNVPEEELDYTGLTLSYEIITQDESSSSFIDGMTINQSIGNFTFKAIPNMVFRGSIVFSSGAMPSDDTESYWPYTIHDSLLSQLGWNTSAGEYSIDVLVYSGKNAQGELVYSDTVNFFVQEAEQASRITGEGGVSFSLTKPEEEPVGENIVKEQNDNLIKKQDNSNSDLGDVFENDIENAQVPQEITQPTEPTQEDTNVPYQTNTIENLTKLPNTGIELRKGFYLGIFMMLVSYDLAILGYTSKLLASLRKLVHEL